jgi:hypothetical protein
LKLSRYRILKDFVSLNLKLCGEEGVYINSYWIRDNCGIRDESVFVDTNPNKQRDILAQKLFSRRTINKLIGFMHYNSDVHTVIYLVMHYPLLVTFVKISPF